MRNSRSIAVAQTCPVAGDVLANLDEHIRLACRAAEVGARVVVFPELSLIGYELELAVGLAFSENDHRLSPLLDSATSHGVTMVVSAPVRLGESLYIGAFIVHPHRTTEIYPKHRLDADNSRTEIAFSAGSSHQLAPRTAHQLRKVSRK
ncbi:MAG: hypothetical protein C0467_23225 [Planctomycetaceae bacterium]|nr:hypothetical protein [Planctomycetaceae bacterium]